MASITIRNLPEDVKERLRVQAAQNGKSLEAYARTILQDASSSDEESDIDIATLAGLYFGSEHGVDLKLPDRKSKRDDVRF